VGGPGRELDGKRDLGLGDRKRSRAQRQAPPAWPFARDFLSPQKPRFTPPASGRSPQKRKGPDNNQGLFLFFRDNFAFDERRYSLTTGYFGLGGTFGNSSALPCRARWLFRSCGSRPLTTRSGRCGHNIIGIPPCSPRSIRRRWLGTRTQFRCRDVASVM